MNTIYEITCLALVPYPRTVTFKLASLHCPAGRFASTPAADVAGLEDVDAIELASPDGATDDNGLLLTSVVALELAVAVTVCVAIGVGELHAVSISSPATPASTDATSRE